MKFYETVFAEKKIELDLLDKKILTEIAKNARTSASAIAKKVETTRDTAHYRIEQLEKNGVIQAYRTIIDVQRFGFMNIHLFLQLNQAKDILEKIIKKLKEVSFIRAIIQFNGKYDMEIGFIAKTIEECDQNIKWIIQCCGDALKQYDVLFITQRVVAHTFPLRFFEAKEKVREEKKEKKQEYTPDEIDCNILEHIADKADVQTYILAKQTNLSADIISYRIKKLQASRYIVSYVPAINYALLNYTVHALLINAQQITAKEEATIATFLEQNKDILWAVKAIGKYNFIIYICTQKMDDFLKTTEELREYLKNHLREYEILLNVEEYKYTYLPKGTLVQKKTA